MKITIEIDDPYIKTLRTWASVSRTLNSAKAACEQLGESDLTPTEIDRASNCYEELRVLEPALNFLHMQVREAIWAIDAEAEQAVMLKRLSKIQTDHYEARGERVIKVEGYAEDGNTITVANGRIDRWKDGSKLL